jgi:hypothetical protein
VKQAWAAEPEEEEEHADMSLSESPRQQKTIKHTPAKHKSYTRQKDRTRRKMLQQRAALQQEDHWQDRVSDEREIMQQVGLMLASQRSTIKTLQKELSADQEEWRYERRDFQKLTKMVKKRKAQGVGRSELERLERQKTTAYDRLRSRKTNLDAAATELNADIRALRSIQYWINDKEDDLQQIDREVQFGKENVKAGRDYSPEKLEDKWIKYLQARKHGPNSAAATVPYTTAPTVRSQQALGDGMGARVHILQNMLSKWQRKRTGLNTSLQKHSNWLADFSSTLQQHYAGKKKSNSHALLTSPSKNTDNYSAWRKHQMDASFQDKALFSNLSPLKADGKASEGLNLTEDLQLENLDKDVVVKVKGPAPAASANSGDPNSNNEFVIRIKLDRS